MIRRQITRLMAQSNYTLFRNRLGFLESPVYSYIGEIAEPKIRTVLSCTTSLTYQLSGAFIFSLSNIMPWRDVSLICAAVPIVAAFTMFIVSISTKFEFDSRCLRDLIIYNVIRFSFINLGTRDTSMATIAKSEGGSSQCLKIFSRLRSSERCTN